MISFVWIFEDFKQFKFARERILARSSKRARTRCPVRLDTCQHWTSKHTPYNTRKWSYHHLIRWSQNHATIEFQQKYDCWCGWQPHAHQPGQHNDEHWSSNTAPSPFGWLKFALHLSTQHRAVSWQTEWTANARPCDSMDKPSHCTWTAWIIGAWAVGASSPSRHPIRQWFGPLWTNVRVTNQRLTMETQGKHNEVGWGAATSVWASQWSMLHHARGIAPSIPETRARCHSHWTHVQFVAIFSNKQRVERA